MPLREEITVEETVLDEAPIELDNVVELTAAKRRRRRNRRNLPR